MDYSDYRGLMLVLSGFEVLTSQILHQACNYDTLSIAKSPWELQKFTIYVTKVHLGLGLSVIRWLKPMEIHQIEN